MEFGRAVRVAGLHLRLEGGQFGRDGVKGGAGLLVLGGRLALALLRRADRLEDGQGRVRGGAGGEGAPLGLGGGMVAPLGCFELCLEPRALRLVLGLGEGAPGVLLAPIRAVALELAARHIARDALSFDVNPRRGLAWPFLSDTVSLTRTSARRMPR